MRKLIPLLLFALCSFSNASGQTEGNNVFGSDQVLSVDVTFYNSNFWSILNDEYEGDQNYIPAGIAITSNTGTTTLDSVGIRLKGNSSMNHPGDKKPFKVDFNRFISGQSYDLLKKLNFNNGFKDPTFVREKIFYDVCEAAGILSPRATFAEVTFNGTPWGFYTVVEQIDDQFLDRSIGDDEGHLFKAGSNFGGGDDEASLVYLGADQALYENAYDLKQTESNGWDDLIDLIEFINNATDDAFETELADRLDLTPYLQSAALDNLFSNLDTYTLSARNYYLYFNVTSNEWQWIKWDSNETFGSYAFGVPGNMTELDLDFDGGNQDRPLLERIMASDALRAAYHAEMCWLRENWFNSAFLEPRLDELKALIQSAVYADDNKMFSNNQFENNFNTNQGGMGGTLYGLKPFIEDRADYVDSNLDCTASIAHSDAGNAYVSVYPNPASEELNITFDEPFTSLCIFNAQGQEVLKMMNPKPTVLRVQDWPQGVYLMVFETATCTETTRVILQ
jgi:spore coat protein CotH